ncbi:GIY-YIG nuclease family protein [Micromonospora sp. MED01]|uniref:GIY-YIG nuclease family protein n=1 Tax=Micromonospora alfalfae TaxID=2911212 RepID=UPI001EE81C49|nr:GIY-YIG nuclease family protein [Micromonospora alfalfae]MCG5460863.1 GIY-YIG nuclease family protein [Micromonospora alfalfae]
MTSAAPVDVPTCLYRFYDRTGRLLYIGITVNPPVRFTRHSEDKPWWPEVDHTQTTLTWFDSRAEAEAVELPAVRDERPLHNVVTADADGNARFIRDPKRPWGRPVTVLTPHQEQLLLDAVSAGELADEADRKLWEVVEVARNGGVPDVLLCDRSGISRATLNRRLGPRRTNAA